MALGIKAEWVGATPEQVADHVGKIREQLTTQFSEQIANMVRERVISRTPIGDPLTDPHSGQLKASWTPVEKSDVSFSFSTDLDYAIILEEGLYKGVGKRTIGLRSGKRERGSRERRAGSRTVVFGPGIYSRQAPGGMITPVVTDPTLTDAIYNMVMTALGQPVTSGI